MGEQLDSRTSLSGKKRKKRTRPAPTSRELAKRYFDLQCLRLQVRLAESGRMVGPELTKSLAPASFA